MSAVLNPPAPDPDDRAGDAACDYVTEGQLHDLGIDPVLVRLVCPHATELRALDGSPCWARGDLAELLDAEGGLQ